MKKKLGSSLGLFALVRKDDALIYVHSKLCIVDDKFASIGSAKSNPRGFRMDTELDFTWHNAGITGPLRMDLWKEILGNPPTLNAWKPKEFVKKWTDLAKKHEGASASARKGFVVRFANTNKGRKHFLDLSPFT